MFLLCAPVALASPTAEGLLRQGRLQEALTVAVQEAHAKPADLDTQELYIDMLLTIGMAGRAEREFTARAKAAPLDANAQYLLGRALVDPRDARTAYERALKIDPDHARAHMGVAAVHSALGKNDASLAAYARATKLDPSLGEAWLGLLRAQLMAEQPEQALLTARAGLSACPSEPGLYLAVATMDPASAAPVLKTGIQAVPDDARLHEALAGLQLNAGDFKAADAAAKAALTLDPTLTDAGLTALYSQEVLSGRLTPDQLKQLRDTRSLAATDPTQARARFDTLVEAAPSSSLVWMGRADLRTSQGDTAGALTDLIHAIDADPTQVEVNAVTGRLLLAQGRPAEAGPMLTWAWDQRPWDPSLAVALATALQQTQQADQALTLLELAAARHPLNVPLQVHYAQALLTAGAPQRAYEVVERALLMLPDPRLAAAFVLVATESGHYKEAASLLRSIVGQTSSPQIAQAIQRLDEMAAKAP